MVNYDSEDWGICFGGMSNLYDAKELLFLSYFYFLFFFGGGCSSEC